MQILNVVLFIFVVNLRHLICICFERKAFFFIFIILQV